MVNLVARINYFHFFEALNDASEVQIFSGLHFYTLSQILIACRFMQLRNISFIPKIYCAYNFKISDRI